MMKPQIPDLIPVRMLNEFTYCPRLAYLEWVQGEFADNASTMGGQYDHRRVDQPSPSKRYSKVRQNVEELGDLIHGKSIKLSASETGLIGIIDLVEGAGNHAIPVDYKHGNRPDIPGGVWDSDRIQLGAQALMLMENGQMCEYGVVYYCASKTRQDVQIDEPLLNDTREAIKSMRDMAESGHIPDPLTDSPKCPRCSLVSICLPDEVHHCAHPDQGDADHPMRRLVAANTDRIPLYVHTQGTRIGKKKENISIKSKGEPDRVVRLLDISQVAVFGGVQVSTQTVNTLCGHGIPLCYFSHGGWFYGMTTGLGHKNIELRMNQYKAVNDKKKSLDLAKRFIESKIRNSRTMLRRNMLEKDQTILRDLKSEFGRVQRVKTFETLLGYEGNAARLYFKGFPGMLKPQDHESMSVFKFENRNRRPPKDPVNALLSFAYSMLTKDMTVTLQSVGFDPYLGFYHSAKYGRPALSLDLIEEFRPIIADSVVLNVINNSIIVPSDFVCAGGGINLTQTGRKKFLQAYERRLDQEITHPVFKYKISYRQVFEIQARLLGRFLSGEIPEFPMFLVR